MNTPAADKSLVSRSKTFVLPDVTASTLAGSLALNLLYLRFSFISLSFRTKISFFKKGTL
jgi:hypothetical protein